MDGAVGIVALADVEQARNAANVAEVELVEAVLAASQGKDHAVLRDFFGELGVVITARLGSVTAADQEKVLDVAALDRFDNLVGYAENRVVAKAD